MADALPMEVLARWLVHQPAHILAVALAIALLWALLRTQPQRAHRTNALLVAAFGGFAYAGWEWWVRVETPEADIRVDLLVIWPLVAMLTLWAILRAALRRKATRFDETSE